MTSRMLLTYLEREGGRAAVDAVLGRCGVADREEQLRDENYWFGFDLKMRMFDAAAEVLGDPEVARHMGEASTELNVGATLKVALRAFGSPRLVYSNIITTSGKFNTAHRFDIEELSATRATLRYTDVAGIGYHHHDCRLNVGLLSVVPVLFGQPLAEVRHDECALEGADACVYDISWGGSMAGLARMAAGWAGASAAVLASAALVAMPPLALAAVVPIAGAGLVGRRATWTRRKRGKNFEALVREQQEVADRLSASLQDLVSELRLEDVLDKITANAHAAVTGKEFALLVPEDGAMRCRSSSGLSAAIVETLERWATDSDELPEQAVAIDDLAGDAQLAQLASGPDALGSLHAGPLVFRGGSFGVLVALGHGRAAFLPRDVTLLHSYAAQAAIALANAHMVERLERLASQDPLTGLLNHREFHEAVERELERCRRYERNFSVVLMDLDDFKRVNDEDGHATGDRVLQIVAGELAASCRPSDLACRIGGDEFALILPETGVAGASQAGERIQRAVEALDVGVRLTFGVGEWPTDGPSKDMLLGRADASLYDAKRARAAEERARAIGGAAGSRRAAEARDFEQRRRVASGRLNGNAATIERFLAAAREQLGVEIAFLSEFAGERLVVRAVAASDDWLAIEPDTALPLEESFCVRMAEGRIPGLVPDVQTDACVADMALVQHTDIASYVGVPVRLSSGELYGAICCLGRRPGDELGERDVRFVSALGRLLACELERHDVESENRRLQGEVAGVHALIAALDARDRYTGKHSKTVVQLSTMVARTLGLSDDEIFEVEQVALLHDIGKVGIPDAVLQKEGPLDDHEWKVMREHPGIGARIISSIDSLAHLAPLIRAEHERWDGRGYPDRLAGADIPVASRIVFACDAYHAMTSDRPYRPAMSAGEALAEVRRCAGTQFDPAVAAALVEALAPEASPA